MYGFIVVIFNKLYKIRVLQVTELVYGEGQDILKIFSRDLNFKTRQFKRIDGGWGNYDVETHQWTGMVSNLVKKEADFLAASLARCCGREEAVDYFWTLREVGTGFSIKSKQLTIHYLI